MTQQILITDNYNNHYSKIFGPYKLSKDQTEDIKNIANKSIAKIQKDNPGFLVYPEDLECIGDGFNDDEKQICSLYENQGGTSYIETSNTMGWVSFGESNHRTEIKIFSRFDSNLTDNEPAIDTGDIQVNSTKRKIPKDKNDFFMYYLISRIGGVHEVSFEFNKDSKNNFTTFLMLLFPRLLKNAVSQGVYKEYKNFEHNDSNVRGVIDINKHIRYNNPFVGKVAYYSREYSYDNSVTQLIRHTIEYIKEQKFGRDLLSNDEDTMSCIDSIYQSTPSYCNKDRGKVISENMRPKVHPFYTEYIELQSLCVKILHEEGESFGVIESDEKIHGILFDGAWLWESYIAELLAECHIGINHPDNIAKTDAFSMFKRRYELDNPNEFFNEDRREVFPDFYNDKCVIDAKYKNLRKKIQREDLYQVISYMHTMPRNKGCYIYPYQQKETISPKDREKIYKKFVLNGKDENFDTIHIIPFVIPYYEKDQMTWNEFSKLMHDEEKEFKRHIKLIAQ